MPRKHLDEVYDRNSDTKKSPKMSDLESDKINMLPKSELINLKNKKVRAV